MSLAQTLGASPIAGPVMATGGFRVIENRAEVAAWLRDHSRHPLSLLLRNAGGRIFADRNGGGIGFIETGRSLLCIGGIVPGSRSAGAVLGDFLDWCAARGVKARFVHITREEARLLDALGYRVEQIGASYQLAFRDAVLAGSAYRQVRRKLNHARRAGVVVEEVRGRGRFEALGPAFAEIDAEWLREKRAKPLRHLVYAFDLVAPGEDERVFVAWHGDRAIAYLVFSRVMRRGEPAWFHNLSRRRSGCVDGTMQAIVAAFLESSPPGVLHFGFTPLVEMTPPEFRHAALFARIARWLSDRGGLVYPARAQRQYKMSWAPDRIVPEYFAYRENTLVAALGLLRATNAI